MSIITIHLDDKPLQMPTGNTLADLLEQLQRAPESVATALNGQFVARDARPDTVLNEGDQVLLFKPIVGG
jgi:sulfur carrier protein